MKNALNILDRLEETLVILMIGMATVIIFLAVLHRYGSGYEIPYVQDWLISLNMSWAQELCIYMFVWMAKFGAAYGVRTGIHVGVDVLVNALPPNKQKILILTGLGGGILFTSVIAYFGTHFVYSLSKTSQVTPDLEWPVWIVYLAIPLGSGLMCFRFIQTFVSFHRSGQLPKHDHGFVEGLEKI